MFLREPRLPKNDRKNNRNQSNAYTLGLLYRLFQGDASSSTGLSLSWSGTLCSAGEDHGQSIAAADVIRSTVLPVLILAIKARGGICFRTQCPIVVRSPASKLSPVASPPFDPKHPCFTHGVARVGCRPSCS